MTFTGILLLLADPVWEENPTKIVVKSLQFKFMTMFTTNYRNLQSYFYFLQDNAIESNASEIDLGIAMNNDFKLFKDCIELKKNVLRTLECTK